MNKKILIIDDNKEICELYQTIFELEGFEVQVAYDGIRGIVGAVEFKPDFIILDIMMPQADGFEVLRTIKNQTSLETTVIVSSNIGTKEDEKKALDLGAKKYLRKSDYTPNQVLATIKEMMKKPEDSSKKKVMIVDDNEEICEMYKIVLELEGYEVKVEYDGLKGLTGAIEFKPDFIILDIMMPQANGYEVLESIKTCSDLKTTIIVSSNLSSAEDERKALDLGATRYLRKSDYTPNEVVKIIKKIQEGK